MYLGFGRCLVVVVVDPHRPRWCEEECAPHNDFVLHNCDDVDSGESVFEEVDLQPSVHLLRRERIDAVYVASVEGDVCEVGKGLDDGRDLVSRLAEVLLREVQALYGGRGFEVDEQISGADALGEETGELR